MPEARTQTAFSADCITDSRLQISYVKDIVRHIRHITNIGGIEVCALGSDFDGIENALEFGDASGIDMIADALKKEGFSEDDIDKIFFSNVLRLYQEVLA